MSDKQKIINGLVKAYLTELETGMNLISHSSNLEGVDDVTYDSDMTMFACKDSSRTLFEGYLRECSK